MPTEDIDRAVTLYATGHSLRYISRELAWSVTTVRRYLIRAGVELRSRGGNKNKPVPQDKIRIAAHLYRKGLSASQVGEKMGIAEVTALRYLKLANEPRRTNKNATHCKWGHPFTPANTVIFQDGKRRCRRCKNKKNREWIARARRAAESVG